MGHPNFLVPVALVAFLVAVAVCFAWLEPRRAVLWTLLCGWLFLPHFDARYSLLMMHLKAMYVPAVVLAGSVALDSTRWRRLRPSLLDLPVLVLCLVPFATALDNGLGLKEAAAATIESTLSWGAPYLLGRAYLGHGRGARDLATALVVAALAYVPLCLWEMRMSPQLHTTLYGFRTFGFDQAVRFGGYRPSVFMVHGLALGMFMASATLVAFWSWRTGALTSLGGVGLGWVVAVLAGTTVLCRSTGATLLLAAGVAVLEAMRRLRNPVLFLALALVPPAYCAARIAGWSPDAVIALSGTLVDPERGRSLEFRFRSEDRLVEKARVKPWLGWGRYGRSFVYDEEGNNVGAITDGLWIIAFGFTGLVGLVALGATLVLPPVLLLRAYPARFWADPRLAPAAAFAVAILLWAVDDLLNAMMTPLFPAMAGALGSMIVSARSARTSRGRSPREARGDEREARDPGRREERPRWQGGGACGWRIS